MNASWNLWHGCKKYSEGCQNCYVYRTDGRYGRDSSVVAKTNAFYLPLAKKRDNTYKIPSGALVYTCFTSDFLLDAADEWRAEAWEMMHTRSDLNFLFITKRINRLRSQLPDNWNDGYDNVIIGCTAESQKQADLRLPEFNLLPIKHRIIICEPLLEQINLAPYLNSGIEQVVAGGESGFYARPCRYEWVLSIREQCADAGVRFHFKQTGAVFVKNCRTYNIPRRLQHSQARKAGIDYFPDKYQS